MGASRVSGLHLAGTVPPVRRRQWRRSGSLYGGDAGGEVDVGERMRGREGAAVADGGQGGEARVEGGPGACRRTRAGPG
ncbi:hypothetical protein RB628_30655 [Streptomyces sp. ADMS]|uniref:hypothetical protein n=1 Tax=Streptomyces sp. ADMS TaxID=3071415 RepID=UPI00296FB8F5|nr:hypothetical protein [Streptomyces sp. ADMS]MDW4909585.1 hypothetical protein [Streptomyces sp. ADMS]